MSAHRTLALIDDLRQLPAEMPWVEFKENNADALLIGKLISALSNAARLAGQPFAYVLWGVRDADHAAVGTTFEPFGQLQQGQPLELWLAQRLQPGIAFEFKPLEYHGTRLVLLEIPAATNSPVEFERQSLYPHQQRHTPPVRPSRALESTVGGIAAPTWETGVAAPFLSGDEVLARLDYAAYFELTGQPLPDNRKGIFDKLHGRPSGAGRRRRALADYAPRRHFVCQAIDGFRPPSPAKALRFVAYSGLSRADSVTHRQDVKKAMPRASLG